MKLDRKKLLIGIIIVVIIWFCSGMFIYYNFDIQEKGIIGDMFGAINALFSGLALFGIIVSILIQQEELSLQRFELNKTREEFKINRLTNILYRQIEQTNKMMENTRFDIKKSGNTESQKLNLEDFLIKLDDIEKFGAQKKREKKINTFLENNILIMTVLVRKVHNSFKSFDELLNKSNLDNEQINQMKSLFRENLNFSWHNFTSYYLSIIGKRIKTSEGELKVARKRLLIEMLEKYQYFDQYGGVR